MCKVDEGCDCEKWTTGLASQTDIHRFLDLTTCDGSKNYDTCFGWKGDRKSQGYGAFSWRGGRQIAAHRFAYMIIYGEIPAGFHVHHTCRNPSCVRPLHIEVHNPKKHREITRRDKRNSWRGTGWQTKENHVELVFP